MRSIQNLLGLLYCMPGMGLAIFLKGGGQGTLDRKQLFQDIGTFASRLPKNHPIVTWKTIEQSANEYHSLHHVGEFAQAGGPVGNLLELVLGRKSTQY